ncbi:MAG: hypothetical protein ACREOE_19055, partial [Gemmatimonadales bacterium]
RSAVTATPSTSDSAMAGKPDNRRVTIARTLAVALVFLLAEHCRLPGAARSVWDTDDARQRRRAGKRGPFGHAERRWRSALGNVLVASAKRQ